MQGNFEIINLQLHLMVQNIRGVAQDLILNVKGQALTLIYVDATNGWINVQNAEDTDAGTPPLLQQQVELVSTSKILKYILLQVQDLFVFSSLSPTPA